MNIVTVGGGFEGYTATFRANASNYGAGAGGYAMVKQGKMTVSANYNFNYNDRPRGYSDSYRENYESDTENILNQIAVPSRKATSSMETWKAVMRSTP